MRISGNIEINYFMLISVISYLHMIYYFLFSKRSKEYLVNIVRTVLLKARITNFKCFNKLYTVILSQIYDKNQSEKSAK